MDIEALKTELDEYGFVMLPELLPAAPARRLGSRLMEIMRQQPNADDLAQGLWGPYNHFDPADDELYAPLVTNPTVHALVEHLLGENFQLNNSTALWRKPGAPVQRLHVDVPFLTRRNRPIPPNVCFLANCIWMLTDFRGDAAGTLFMPFSHHAGRPPRPGVSYRHLATAEGPAGSAVVFNGALWHAGGANTTTDQHRMGLTTPFTPGWLDPTDTTLATWKLMKRSVWARMPEPVQKLFRHLQDG